MSTPDVAEKSLKNAAGLAYFVAGMTALLSLLAWFNVFHLLSPLSIIDAALFAVTGFFIGRGSRVAAIVGLTLYLLEAADRLLSGSGGTSGGFSVVVIFFTLFFINGVRGAFSLVRLRKQSEEATPIG